MLAQTVEETIRATGVAQVEAQEVGLAILGPLRSLDEVAFMRYASVYQGWETLEDFEAAIAVLKVERESQI
jgi:transcriptional repressor NrdR